LNDALLLHQLFNVGELGRKEGGEIFHPCFSDNHSVLVTKVEVLFGNPELRVDREGLAWFQRASVIADIVAFAPNRTTAGEADQ